MKFLLIGDIGIIFTYEYITEIASNFSDCEIDILSFSPRKQEVAAREEKLLALGCKIYYQPQYKLCRKHKIFFPLIRFGELYRYRMCKNYDIINIHFPGVDSVAACRWAGSKTRIITSIYGSDVLRASKRGLGIIKEVMRRSDVITVASSYIKDQISRKFNKEFDNKTEIARYGSIAAAQMSKTIASTTKAACKKQFNFPEQRITVLCGYNGSRAQRHIEILKELQRLSGTMQKKIFLVLQCSYGLDKDYYEELSDALKTSQLEGVIVTDFMQGETLAKFRNSIDIFLNLQPTDVLSATMIEELEANALVVKGDWLCYPDLERRNIYMRSISDMENLSQELVYIVEHFDSEQEKTRANKGVWEILSWESQYETWKQIICDIK